MKQTPSSRLALPFTIRTPIDASNARPAATTMTTRSAAPASFAVDALLAELTLLVERDENGHIGEEEQEVEEEEEPSRRAATSEAPEEGEVREDTPEQLQPPVPPIPTPAAVARAALNAKLRDALAARPQLEDYITVNDVRAYLQKRGETVGIHHEMCMLG